MRGEIIRVDGLSGDGLISGDDGVRYSFTASAARTAVTAGDRVDFVAADGVASEIMVMGRAGPAADSRPASTVRPYDAAYNFGWAMFALDGRLRRSHFWISWLILAGAGVAVNFIPFFGIFLMIGLIWMHVAIGAKRFHDIGLSGWLIAIPWGTIVLAWVVMIGSVGLTGLSNPDAFQSGDMTAVVPAAAFLGLSWLVGIGFWLWLGIADGQRGQNRHGRNPKYPHEDAAGVFA